MIHHCSAPTETSIKNWYDCGNLIRVRFIVPYLFPFMPDTFLFALIPIILTHERNDDKHFHSCESFYVRYRGVIGTYAGYSLSLPLPDAPDALLSLSLSPSTRWGSVFLFFFFIRGRRATQQQQWQVDRAAVGRVAPPRQYSLTLLGESGKPFAVDEWMDFSTEPQKEEDGQVRTVPQPTAGKNRWVAGASVSFSPSPSPSLSAREEDR